MDGCMGWVSQQMVENEPVGWIYRKRDGYIRKWIGYIGKWIYKKMDKIYRKMGGYI